MFKKLFKTNYPVGVKINKESISLAQLEERGKSYSLTGATEIYTPDNITWKSDEWIKWAAQRLNENVSKKLFNDRDIVGSVAECELHIENLNLKDKEQKQEQNDNIAAIISEKLSCKPSELLIKTAKGENENYVAMAIGRESVEKYIEVYKQANLNLKAIGVWPVALVNSYINFFGRRETDKKSVVMLIDLESDIVRIVICRHEKLLFAKSLYIETDVIQKNLENTKRLIMELKAAKHYFDSNYNDTPIERIVFFYKQGFENSVYADIAAKMDIPAHIGDCLKAIEIKNNENGNIIDRREQNTGWADVFGLSLYRCKNA
jgi:Tfp pilus assembly PilM family ATPase